MNTFRITNGHLSAEKVEQPRLLQESLLFGCCFLLIFGPKSGEIIDVISLVAAGCAGYYFLMRGKARYVPKGRWWLPLGLFYALLTYSLLVVLFSSQREYFHPIRFARVGLNYLGCLALVGMYRDRYGATYRNQLLLHLFLAGVLHALIMELQFASDGFRAWVYSWTGRETESFILDSGKRVTGLTLSYASLALVQGFAVMIAPVLIERWPQRISRFWYLAGLAVLVPALILAGRTGFYVMGGLSCLVLVLKLFAPSATHRSFKALSVLLIPIGIFAFVQLLSLQKFELLDTTFQRLIVVFEEQDTYGILGRTWSHVLQNMYFLPGDIWTTVFGSSISGRGQVYVASDVGYVLYIFGIGVVGLAMVVGFYLYALDVALKFRRIDPDWALITVLFTLAVLFQNGKEVILLTRHGFSVTCFLLCAWYFADVSDSRRLTTVGMSIGLEPEAREASLQGQN